MNFVPACYRFLIFCQLFYIIVTEDKLNHEANLKPESKSLFQIYEERICQPNSLCKATSNSSINDLRIRNCMCDEKCVDYDDCCLDAHHILQSPSKNFTCAKTSQDDSFYMIKSCPELWNNTSIIEQCHAKNQITLSYDVFLKIPVTNIESGTTYGNVFCAICNNETKYSFWNIGFSYKPFSAPNIKLLNETSDLDSNQYAIKFTTKEETEKILSKLSFNETGELLWSSNLNGSIYKCSIEAKPPKEITAVRYCIPEIIRTCSNGSLCTNYSNYVFVDGKVYKNSQCAKCNQVLSNGTCERDNIKSDRNVTELQFSNSAIPKVSHCQEFPNPSTAYDLFCTEDESKSKLVHWTQCFGAQKKGKSCYINGFFHLSTNDFYFINNETIFVHNYDDEFPLEEWQSLDNDTVFVCGTTIPLTRYQAVMGKLNDFITEVLIKISIICVLLHLLVFTQLTELQNLSGKNLASFCVALLLAFIMFDLGQFLPSCEIPSIGVHYCFLSCFSWMLIMSYDVWLSLYRATSQLRTSGGKHAMKFVIYSIIGWTLPMVVVGPAIYVELASPDVINCNYKPGYGQYGQCFISQKKPIYYFFFIPASIIFLANICFFAHTAYMIFLSQRKTVNPNTRHDFRLYSRLGLLMGLTWTLGSLVTITNSEIIGLLFTIFNMSQGIFIFVGFTFKKKTLKGLLQKHKDNQFIHTALSTLASKVDMVPSEDATRQTQTEAM